MASTTTVGALSSCTKFYARNGYPRVNGRVPTCRALNKPSIAGGLTMTYISILSNLPAQAEDLVDFGKGGNADPKSYFTVLALFLLSVPGKEPGLKSQQNCAKLEYNM